MKIFLIGMGLGNPDTLTVGAKTAMETCDLLIGARRLLEAYGHKRCLPLIAPQEIFKAIQDHEHGDVAVLFSGDVGFYSGAKQLLPLLENYDVRVLPGVSSVQYACAKWKTPWQDCHLISAHGRSHNAIGHIQCHEKSFVLLGSNFTAMDLVTQLVRRGLGACQVSIGERLSYGDERFVTGTAFELEGQVFDTLSVALVVNPNPIQSPSGGLSDDAFLRGKVPMTKGEVRAVALSKLAVAPHHTVWDVGAGTGAVTVELGYQASAGQVFAVEQKGEAVALLKENKAKFALPNITIVEGTAPEALADLPAPDRVFIGGSSGNLEEIVALILGKNPVAWLVITAVTLETLAQATTLFAKLQLPVDMVQLSATRTRKAGSYHLMDAQNPVWIITAQGGM